MPLPAFVKVMLVTCLLGLPAAAQTAAPRVLTVNGEGRVSVVPDMATVSAGVQTLAETAEAALRQNSAAMQKIFGVLSEAGIEARDMQTGALSLYPQYGRPGQNDGDAPVIAGYVASNVLTVRVRALDELGTVLDRLGQAGANQINGVSFGLQDPGPATDAARKAAVADAQARAKLYAGAAGVRLGDVQSLSEQATGRPGPVMMNMARAEAAFDVPVAEGELDITAEVQIVWAIE